MRRDRSGQALASGVLMVIVLLLVAAGLVDAYALLEARAWGYRVAEAAALRGASRARDWEHATATGEMRLLEDIAQSEAMDLVGREMAVRGVAEFEADVRVLPETSGGAVLGFPPLAVASQFGESGWSEDGPSVGVYLAFPVETFFFGLVVPGGNEMEGGHRVQVHVFAAAGAYGGG